MVDDRVRGGGGKVILPACVMRAEAGLKGIVRPKVEISPIC